MKFFGMDVIQWQVVFEGTYVLFIPPLYLIWLHSFTAVFGFDNILGAFSFSPWVVGFVIEGLLYLLKNRADDD